jgi:hypothetical protein
MTYDEDPRRWTSSPDEAPELLRGAFAAGREEGPSRAQMRSLALKIAAASAGGAVAVGTVKAASAGQAVATAASWSVGKVAAVVALAGTIVTGGAVIWKAGTSAPEATLHSQRTATEQRPNVEAANAEPANVEPGQANEQAATVSPIDPAAVRRSEAPVVESLAGKDGAAIQKIGAADGADRGSSDVGTNPGKAASARRTPVGAPEGTLTSKAARSPESAARAPAAVTRSVTKPNAPPSEIELLRRAQVALQGRPREAFQLTQEHRRLYPSGEFAQERDALAIQALMRTGDTDKARDLATSFIRAHPSSPHAHRFREAMGIH